jgi:hypothetical protein
VGRTTLPLAVLIIASESGDDASGTLAAMLPIAGQTLLEYQVRLARACGGGHIVVLVEQLPAAMVAVFDQLRSDGIDIDIAREPRDAADRIHPDEQVLLFAPGFVGSRQIVETLIARASPTLVTLPDQPAHVAFERIDATERWSGLALLKGQSIRETAAMLGDWSISSTLMRTALQSGAARWRFEQPDGLIMISTVDQAETMSARLVRDNNTDDQSPLADLIFQPLAKMIVPHLFKWALPVDLIAVMPLILAGSAFLLATLGWFATGFVFFCFATLADAIVETLFAVAMRNNASMAFFKRAKPFIFFALLLLLGWEISRATGNWASLLLAGWGSSIFLIQPQSAAATFKWRASIETGSIVMVLALLFSVPIAGLLVIVCHGLAGQIADRFFRS